MSDDEEYLWSHKEQFIVFIVRFEQHDIPPIYMDDKQNDVSSSHESEHVFDDENGEELDL